ncbi:MAG: VanZ family protein [Gammaproteobacteria bacterium]|nr:VanZ family protein [Gammaproteobacteria bacterium]MDH4313394.1 VanZ family protein [Gammaproteobacteria bacterium]MDH5214228.1 VanZ family protein [Gammaproteobacteria bacterium]
MLELRYAATWRLLSVVSLLLILAATIVPSDWLWPNDRTFHLHISDKWLHGITFAGLALWFSGQYAKSCYWRIALGLLAFGLLIEIVQRAVSYRSAELLDLVADVVGIAAGLILARAGLGGWTPRLEDWLQERFG